MDFTSFEEKFNWTQYKKGFYSTCIYLLDWIAVNSKLTPLQNFEGMEVKVESSILGSNDN